MSAPAPGTPLPWQAGSQNDALFIIAGRKPSLNNDYPQHDAPRVALARVFGPNEFDCLPIDADANAAYIVHAANCFPELVEALKGIAMMRPAGDIATASHTRALVERIEKAALAALAKAGAA